MEREGEGTKFTIDRKIFSSDIWFSSPWKLKIWFYLIGNANYKDGEFMGIPIKRGQLIRSYRTIRKACGYRVGYRMKYPSFDTVRRICEELTKELRIEQRTVHAGTLFTICNYSTLQPLDKSRSVQRSGQLSFNGRSNTVQNNKDKKVKNIKYTSDFLTFWKTYPKKTGKGAAFNSWKRISKSNGLIDELMGSLKNHLNCEQWQRDNGQYIPNPATWLNQRRWEDELESQQKTKTPHQIENEDLYKWRKSQGIQ
jgi:hypothetical protein